MIILYLILILNLFSVEYDQIKKDYNNKSIENIYSITESKGTVYFNMIDKIFKYNNGALNEINIIGYEDYFDNLFTDKLQIDNFNNLIFNSTYGLAIYNNQTWQYFSKVDYPELFYNGQYHFKNDTLVLRTAANATFSYFIFDKISKKYQKKEQMKEYLNKGESFRIKNIWEYDEKYNIFCVNANNKILNINTTSSNVTDLTDLYNINLQKIKTVKKMIYTNQKLYLSVENQDTTVSIIILQDDLTKEEYIFKNYNFINNRAVTDDFIIYKNYAIISAGTSQLYIVDLLKREKYLLLPPKQIEDSPKGSEWNVRTLFVDSKDTLWIGTFTHGIFKTNINNLILETTHVDNKLIKIKVIYNSETNSLFFAKEIPSNVEIIDLLGKQYYESKVNTRTLNLPDLPKNQIIFAKMTFDKTVFIQRIK